jgi:uncharacterized protein (TIGR00375 family)
MDLDHIAAQAKLKGIDLLGTGDFTHPIWLQELKDKLKEDTNGLYQHNGVKFILTAELSSIYSKKNKGRRVHNIIFAPDLATAERISRKLSNCGNITSDGRPIFGFDAKDIVKICLDISEDCLIVPAHAWTPWFSIFGSNSGFNSVEECFEEEAQNIYALETGLSSDPAMNWRLSNLDKYSLISNSDAHSPSKLGREANVFDTELSFEGIKETLKHKDKRKFLFTIEFFPEEGKYHFDGHRDCQVRFTPQQTKANNNRCPKCGRALTIGVMNRVAELADRPDGFTPKDAIPFKSLVPLIEIIAEIRQKGPESQGVAEEYKKAIASFGNEFKILLDADEEELSSRLPERIKEAVIKVRRGELVIEPGYDGVYGVVKIFGDKDIEAQKEKQMELFQ